MPLESLVNKHGRLAETYPQLDPMTIRHAHEITTERNRKNDLRDKWFLTADSALYTFEDGEAVLYLGRRRDNLIFRNIDEAIGQFMNTTNYVPGEEAIKSVINSESILRVKLSRLRLEKLSRESSYFKINTANYDRKLNKTQRGVAERIYGEGADFVKAMEMLAKDAIKETRIYVLNPSYIKKYTALVQPCRLGSFDNNSNFYANITNIADPHLYLRGSKRQEV